MRTLRRISVVEANSMTFFKLYFFVWILEYFLTLDMEYLHYHNLPYEQVLLLKVYLKRVELLLPTDMEAGRVYWILLGFSKFVLILFKKEYHCIDLYIFFETRCIIKHIWRSAFLTDHHHRFLSSTKSLFMHHISISLSHVSRSINLASYGPSHSPSSKYITCGVTRFFTQA